MKGGRMLAAINLVGNKDVKMGTEAKPRREMQDW